MSAPATYGQTLTDRELEIIQGIAAGHTNADIGRNIHIAEDTVKSHIRRMFQKLGAHDRAHAVAIAVNTGLLPAGRCAVCYHQAAVAAALRVLAHHAGMRHAAPAASRIAVLYDDLTAALTQREQP